MHVAIHHRHVGNASSGRFIHHGKWMRARIYTQWPVLPVGYDGESRSVDRVVRFWRRVRYILPTFFVPDLVVKLSRVVSYESALWDSFRRKKSIERQTFFPFLQQCLFYDQSWSNETRCRNECVQRRQTERSSGRCLGRSSGRSSGRCLGRSSGRCLGRSLGNTQEIPWRSSGRSFGRDLYMHFFFESRLRYVHLVHSTMLLCHIL